MTVIVKNDPIQLICEVCEEFLPDDLSVQVHFSIVETKLGEGSDMALVTDGKKEFFILLNDKASYEDIPHMIASQVAIILSHLEGAQCKSGTKNWHRHMESIQSRWIEKIKLCAIASSTIVIH